MFCSTQQSGVVVVAVAVVENVEARDPISRWLRRFFKKDCPRSSPFLLWFKFLFFWFFFHHNVSRHSVRSVLSFPLKIRLPNAPLFRHTCRALFLFHRLPSYVYLPNFHALHSFSTRNLRPRFIEPFYAAAHAIKRKRYSPAPRAIAKK